MAMVNIPSTCDDPAYRYKMPRLVLKKEGSGNGKKTWIVNMGDVARALKVPPQYTTKWFGNELGAVSKYTNKENEGERAIINGHCDTSIFQDLLDKFIGKYVCCERCKLPEIDMAIKKGLIVGRCMACGWQGELDNYHKLAAFICKNPPDASGHGFMQASDDKGGKLEKKAKREAKAKKQEKEKDEEDDDGVEVDDDALVKPKEERGKENKHDRKSKKEKKERKKADDDDNDANDDKEHEIKRDRKGKKEKKEKHKKVKDQSDSNASDSTNGKDDNQATDNLTYDHEETKNVIQNVRDWISKTGAEKVTVDDLFEEVRAFQLAKAFDHKIRLFVALASLCGERMGGKEVDKYKKHLERFIKNAKMCGQDVLWAFNAYIAAYPGALKAFPLAVKVAYDEDWMEEQMILAYYEDDERQGDPGFDDAKKVLAPFLKWLREAEESSDEDSESD